jgi:hypothetical protein
VKIQQIGQQLGPITVPGLQTANGGKKESWIPIAAAGRKSKLGDMTCGTFPNANWKQLGMHDWGIQ